MNQSDYLISYVVMDTLAGANPFHHSFILLSKKNDKGAIEAKSAFGFYSEPSKSANPIANAFWGAIGLQFKFKGSHGVLKKEKMREIDGLGLKARHFNVSEKQYNDVLKHFEDQLEKESEAIKEYKKDNPTIQPEEIYSKELKQADKEGRKSRLERFEFGIGINIKGLHTKNSYTCKNYALEILDKYKILPSKTHTIDKSPFGYGLPRTLGDDSFEPLHLFSDGVWDVHTSIKTKKNYYNPIWNKGHLSFGLIRTEKKYYNRTWETGNLLFALPPNQQAIVKQPEIEKKLSALKKLDKRLRKPNDDVETDLLIQSKEQLTSLYKRYSAVTSSNDIDQLLTDTDDFISKAELTLNPVSAGFLFLSWEAMLALSSTVATFVVCAAALSMLSGGSLVIAVPIVTVAALIKSYGVFSSSRPKAVPSLPVDDSYNHFSSAAAG